MKTLQDQIKNFNIIIRRIILKKLKSDISNITVNIRRDESFYQGISFALMPIIDFDRILKKQNLTFSKALRKIIKDRGLKESYVYNKAYISRQLFSKIKNHDDYKPTKDTVIMFALALELSVDETNDLLETAGFTLSHSILRDMLIEFFISKGFYDLILINLALDEHNLPTIGD